jgi:two-component system, chemotaxis family, CheB/CheR fusion protein
MVREAVVALCVPSASAPGDRDQAEMDQGSINPTARRVLVVEDHHDTARLMVRLLGARGYAATAASCGAAALELADRERFDVIVSDLRLPDFDGCTLLAELHRRLGPIPAIALSGSDSDEEVAQCRAAGFCEHLPKPVQLPTLLAAIGRVIG